MFRKFFEQLRWKKLARQLRKPAGAAGIDVAGKMNTANEFLYDFTLDEMMIRENESILEIGFGNGKFFSKQFSRAENLRITGLDFSGVMVRTARKHNKALIKEGNLSLVKGQSDKMPFLSASFDKVFCINVAYFWEDPQEHLLEIYRVLRPGGRLYATIRSRESMNQLPFTRYGFRTYTEEEWKLLCHLNNLLFIRCSSVYEPAFPGPGVITGARSVCLVAEKRSL
ncbi:MAG: class I SAM-dependent methyltransferase [Sphingobacteriales bacterium]|nr:class I SAM-dependent methyltransferase [Sphingobacteriales bacterium]